MIVTSEYEPISGRIYRNQYFDGPEMAEINLGDHYVEGDYRGEEYYILNGQPTERPASPVSLSDLTLFGVPSGSALMINGERYENVEGDVELEFPLPGTYRLRVECWPYKDWEGEVVVP